MKYLLIISMLLITGCSSTGNLKKRASFDLNCAQDQLSLIELGGNGVMGVEGCGQRATYLRVGIDSWAVNSPSK